MLFRSLLLTKYDRSHWFTYGAKSLAGLIAQPELRAKLFKIVTRPKPTKSELSPDKPSQFMLRLSMAARITISNRALPSS